MNWHQRYNRMLAHYRWNNLDVAQMIGNTVQSVREVVRKEPFPRWLKLAIIVFEKENDLHPQEDPDQEASS